MTPREARQVQALESQMARSARMAHWCRVGTVALLLLFGALSLWAVGVIVSRAVSAW
jgi:hypothetical protein